MGIVADFKMQVRTSGASGRSHRGNLLSLFDLHVFFDPILVVMRIDRGQVAGMLDDDHFAVARWSPAAEHHLACSGGTDRRAFFGADVDALMIPSAATTEP